QLQANVANSTEIDMGKVSAIKSAIERGDYAIDAQRISRAVVDLEQLLRA
ncbi:flagellar biosynthesis anti-sigma factor FlgM, partial [Litorivivens sp.]